MQIIPFIEAHDQEASVFMAGRRVTLRLRYNVSAERWAFDLSRDDAVIIHGKRLVIGRDALQAHNLGLGSLFFHDTSADGAAPDYANVASGIVELVHMEPGEVV